MAIHPQTLRHEGRESTCLSPTSALLAFCLFLALTMRVTASSHLSRTLHHGCLCRGPHVSAEHKFRFFSAAALEPWEGSSSPCLSLGQPAASPPGRSLSLLLHSGGCWLSLCASSRLPHPAGGSAGNRPPAPVLWESRFSSPSGFISPSFKRRVLQVQALADAFFPVRPPAASWTAASKPAVAPSGVLARDLVSSSASRTRVSVVCPC